MTEAKYDYGKKPEYQAITVEQWNEIPADQTQYSSYWDNPSAFEPETFAENTQKEKKWNDLGWLIAFWINFAVFIILFIVMVVKGKKNWDNFFGLDDTDDYYNSHQLQNRNLTFKSNSPHNPNNSSHQIQQSEQYHNNRTSGKRQKRMKYYYLSDPEPVDNDDDKWLFTTKIIKYSVGFGVLAALIVNIIHGCYITLAPVIYIKAGFVIIVIIAALACIPAILLKIYLVLIFPVIIALLMICVYCCVKKKIPLSAAILQRACIILWKNPMIFAVIFLEFILQMAIGIVFFFSVLFLIICEWHLAICIYLLFSFYWISNTFGYTLYMATAGVAAEWYFLNGTDFMPRCGVWESFKRATTTSFGSAAFAGFIIAVIDILEDLVESTDGSCAILKCIALCILALLKCCFDVLNKFALIYCATFGVPFLEGCRRWLELETKMFIGTLLNSCMINMALTLHIIVFSLAGAMLGLGFAFMLMKKSMYLKILLPVFAFLFSLCIFAALATPIGTLADTLFVCFAECPENLKTSASELYEKLVEVYGDELAKEIHFQDSP